MLYTIIMSYGGVYDGKVLRRSDQGCIIFLEIDRLRILEPARFYGGDADDPEVKKRIERDTRVFFGFPSRKESEK